MDRVKVFFNSKLPHFSQLITGLECLSKNKVIELSYHLELYTYPVYIFKINYNGLNLFFDLADHSVIDRKIYEKCDFYIKRMLLKTDYWKYPKLIPFGLNYSVFYENTYLKYLFIKKGNLLPYSLKYFKGFSKLFKINDSINNNCLSNMIAPPYFGKQILFRARLWNPDNNETEWKKRERFNLNEERIMINRLLNENFKGRFKGGIQSDAFSKTQCADLLLPKSEYNKSTYLKELTVSSIGIVNQGLENSISWKFGEYVAHSMAIITSSIDQFKLPGNFREGENYLKFESPEHCVELTKMLLKEDGLRTKIQLNNEVYYHEYLHPEAKINQIFKYINDKVGM